MVADYYNMPLFQYIEHLSQTARKYGAQAALMDLRYALELRELKAYRAIEAQERANRM